jgi:hypothetical protein
VKLDLPYVIARPSKSPKYFYFRTGVDSEGKGGRLIAIPGRPGTPTGLCLSGRGLVSSALLTSTPPLGRSSRS